MFPSVVNDDSSLPVATAIGGSGAGIRRRAVSAAWCISTKAAAARPSNPPTPAAIPLPVGSIPMPFGPSSEVIDDWTLLWRCDSEALEARYLENVTANATSGDTDEPMLIRNRFAEAFLGRREVRDAFDPEGRPRQVLRRGTWFYLYDAVVPAQLHRSHAGPPPPPAAPGYLPFSEHEADSIEMWAQSLRFVETAKEQSNEFALGEVMGPGNGHFVIVARAKKSPDAPVPALPAATPVAVTVTSSSAYANVSSPDGVYTNGGMPVSATASVIAEASEGAGDFDPFSVFTIVLERRSPLIPKLATASYAVRRGVELPEQPDEKLCKSTPGHLVFVIHGIGEALWSSDKSPAPSIQVCASRMKALAMESIFSSSSTGIEGQPTPTFTSTTAATPTTNGSVGGGEGPAGAASLSKYVEFVAIEWFDSVHGDELDVTSQTKRITPPTVPLIRDVGNMVAMDVLLYQTPEFQYRITTTVVERLNRFYKRYCALNPTFDGSCSIVGHSLGSVITFDILSSQLSTDGPTNSLGSGLEEPITPAGLLTPADYLISSQTYVAQTLVNSRAYLDALQLDFKPSSFFAIGSPIGIFYTIRSKGRPLRNEFRLPTCPHMYNIFHPHDPVAYRIEPLFDTPSVKEPFLIEHHAGMRLQYQLKKMKVDFQQGIDAVLNAANPATWMSKLSAMAVESATAAQSSLVAATAPAVSGGSSMLSSWIGLAAASFGGGGAGGPSANAPVSSASPASPAAGSSGSSHTSSNGKPNNGDGIAAPGSEGSGHSSSSSWSSMDPELRGVHVNGERRVDFVLQESPMEHTNSYMSALFSHSSYFENKDLVLFILSKLNA